MNLRNAHICLQCGKVCAGYSSVAQSGKHESGQHGYCPFCTGEMIDTKIGYVNYTSLSANDPTYEQKLIEEFVLPHGKYDLSKKAQAEKVIERNRSMNIGDSSNKPKCPTCSSTNIRKMSGIERGASIATFGLFSKKINKTFKCNGCGYTW